MDAQRKRIEEARLAGRADALEEAARLAELYGQQRANVGFLAIALRQRASTAWSEYDHLRETPAREQLVLA